jgi:hypothetical protein
MLVRPSVFRVSVPRCFLACLRLFFALCGFMFYTACGAAWCLYCLVLTHEQPTLL